MFKYYKMIPTNENIAVLIPVKSKAEYKNNFVLSDLYIYLFKSFFKTYSDNFNYTIYLGFQNNDTLFSNIEQQNQIKRFIKVMKNTDIKFVEFDNKYIGNVAGIWSALFEHALKLNKYFIQCGSDICFVDDGWVDKAINILKENDDLGVVGLEDRGRLKINPNDKLLTQSIVSWRHMEIFGFYYPKEILNWGCDDFITEIYDKHNLVYRIKHGFYNMGGDPRYNIDINYQNAIAFCIRKHKNDIQNYINFRKEIKKLPKLNGN